jgi:hypothetical protein
MPDTILNTILTAAFFGVPSVLTVFFTAWLIAYECRKGA